MAVVFPPGGAAFASRSPAWWAPLQLSPVACRRARLGWPRDPPIAHRNAQRSVTFPSLSAGPRDYSRS